MRLRGLSVFLSALAAVALLFVQGAAAAEPGPVTPEEGRTMIRQNKDLFVLDVRYPNEYAAAHYPNALNIPIAELEARLSEVPSGKAVLVYCARGKRSERGYKLLKEKRPDIQQLYYIAGEPIFN